MQADMHNLYPAVGELNADRKNFRFDFEAGKSGQYGECRFEVDFKSKRAKVREELRGTIARTYLYFNKHYKMKLSKQEQQKFEAWNKSYPPSEWEIERNSSDAVVPVSNRRILNPFRRFVVSFFPDTRGATWSRRPILRGQNH